jgi:hypothetical protein
MTSNADWRDTNYKQDTDTHANTANLNLKERKYQQL